MPVRYTCPECHDSGVVPDEMAGKEAKCTCGRVLTVPPLEAAPVDDPALPLHRTGLERRVGDRRKSEDGISAVDRREVVDRRSGTDRREVSTEPRRARIVFLPVLLGLLGFALGWVAIRASLAETLRRAEERRTAAIALETGGEGLVRVQDAAIAHARKLAGPSPDAEALREIARLEEERAKFVEDAKAAPARRADAEREIGATRFSWWVGGALFGLLSFLVARLFLARTA